MRSPSASKSSSPQGMDSGQEFEKPENHGIDAGTLMQVQKQGSRE